MRTQAVLACAFAALFAVGCIDPVAEGGAPSASTGRGGVTTGVHIAGSAASGSGMAASSGSTGGSASISSTAESTTGIPNSMGTTATSAAGGVSSTSGSSTSGTSGAPTCPGGGPLFTPPFDTPVNGDASSLAEGDFNGDGIPDLAVTDSPSDHVLILLGLGDGNFAAGSSFTDNSGLASIAAADLDGDGDLDLVITHSMSEDFSVIAGNGDGTFQAPTKYPLGVRTTSIAVGDLNGDGAPDLALGTTDSYVDSTNVPRGRFSVFINRGDGGLLPQVKYDIGSPTLGLAFADFNGDGRLDVVTANYYSNDASLLFGNGDGTFQAAIEIGGGLVFPDQVASGDFDGDGRIDLLVHDTGSPANVWVFPRFADGGFAPARVSRSGLSGGLVPVDLDGDGALDVVVSAGDESVVFGNGDGTMRAPVTYPADANVNWAVVGDFDRDGHLDIVTANGASRTVSFLRGACTAASCSTRADCSGGRACVSGVCRACLFAAQCGAGEACTAGVCAANGGS